MNTKKCKSGKKQYTSWVTAMMAADRAGGWYGNRSRVYRCPGCRKFHLTTKK